MSELLPGEKVELFVNFPESGVSVNLLADSYKDAVDMATTEIVRRAQEQGIVASTPDHKLGTYKLPKKKRGMM